jgi:hypothetical protein
MPHWERSNWEHNITSSKLNTHTHTKQRRLATHTHTFLNLFQVVLLLLLVLLRCLEPVQDLQKRSPQTHQLQHGHSWGHKHIWMTLCFMLCLLVCVGCLEPVQDLKREHPNHTNLENKKRGQVMTSTKKESTSDAQDCSVTDDRGDTRNSRMLQVSLRGP